VLPAFVIAFVSLDHSGLGLGVRAGFLWLSVDCLLACSSDLLPRSFLWRTQSILANGVPHTYVHVNTSTHNAG
jgi:hypothetical protein